MTIIINFRILVAVTLFCVSITTAFAEPQEAIDYAIGLHDQNEVKVETSAFVVTSKVEFEVQSALAVTAIRFGFVAVRNSGPIVVKCVSNRACVTAAIVFRKAGFKITKPIFNQSEANDAAENLKSKGKKGEDTKGNAEQTEMPGGKKGREKDFDGLPGKEISSDKEGVRIKVLGDGTKVISRDRDTRPGKTGGTIEIQRPNSKKKEKLRY